ncbi:MAG TPA: helix-hairpin-helix domain-containing protein [Gammaproteobacteria bacterium]|jgi:competence protein ComEA|nr:helix-hairpin-helix domain-containing protein [Gammaproteobacteria bacterium]
MKTITTIAALAALVVSSIATATPVNINTASAQQIADALNGVGLSKAQAIVDYREAYGLFSAADEIVFVRGIGDSTFENNKGDILVK